MILGYEQPVSIPGMEIYDKDMVRMYLGALLKDYEQGVADLKEFIKNYGDFVSIMPGATDAYYNAGMRGINDTYDRLVSQGIDPIRSVQGREAMARARMGANTALMANIKADSAAYEQYQKAAGALAANGKFDKNLNDWWLKQNGIDPNNWDFSGNKRWDIISPLQSTTIQELMAPTIAELAKTGYEVDPTLTKNGKKVERVYRKSIDAALNKGIDDLLKDPRMQYYYQTSGLSKEEFLKDLGNRAEGILRPKETEDKYWFDLLNLGINKYKAETGRMNAQTSRQNANNSYLLLMLSTGKYTLDENGKLAKVATPDTIPTHHLKVDRASISKRTIHLGGGSNGGSATNFDKRMGEIIDYWKGLTKNVNYSSDEKFKKKVDRMIKWASRLKEEGISKAIKNGMFTKDENEDLIPTKAYENAYTTIETDAARLNGVTYNKAVNNAMNRRATYKSDITDRVTRLDVATRFAGTSSTQNNINLGDGVKNRVVQLNSETLMFTPYRAIQTSGLSKKADASLIEKFLKFINLGLYKGYFTDHSYSSMQTASIPRSLGGRSYEIDSFIEIPRYVLLRFADSIGKSNLLNTVLRDLGIPGDVRQTTYKSQENGDLTYKNDYLYSVPFTRIENNDNTFAAGDLDNEINKDKWGSKYAWSQVQNVDANSLGRK